MGVSLAARKHPVLTTLRNTKAQRYEKRGRDDIIYVCTAPRGIDPASNQVFDQGTGEFPLPLEGQPGRERGGNGLPKKPARAGKEHEALALQGRFFGGDRLVKKQAYPRPDRQLLGFPISSKLPPVFGPSCMRQKLVPRTVQRSSATTAVRVRLRSTKTKKIQFTQRLPLGSELHMGKERCCLRGLDHLHGLTFHSICGNFMIYKPSLTSDRLMFEHDESLRADLFPIHFPASYENGKLEHFIHRWMKNREHNNFWLTMFPEKRYFRERTSTTEVAIHTNLFTDLYASIGTGSSRTGGCPPHLPIVGGQLLLPLSRLQSLSSREGMSNGSGNRASALLDPVGAGVASRSDETGRPGRINKQREGLLPSTEISSLSRGKKGEFTSGLKEDNAAKPRLASEAFQTLLVVADMIFSLVSEVEFAAIVDKSDRIDRAKSNSLARFERKEELQLDLR
ncbi:hypothetical protein KY290_021225 [Solanum tuberosum]|uniref:Uncharacterized protein n=1 Tax=Solanum tuberosum TaxID=4113 RepID=A0ABQ7V2Z5_SOLTU|nr:hypothetical protein KY290_021225 [Solanum tuberosum]